MSTTVEPRIDSCHSCRTHPAWFDAQFQHLLDAWNEHHDLQQLASEQLDPAAIRRLAESRDRLDEARVDVAGAIPG